MKKIQTLYLLNFGLLATHEVDSAFWHEWEMFHLPGGIQLFLVLNLLLFLLFLAGFAGLLRHRREGIWASAALSGAGLAAVVIHGTFLGLGNDSFTLPVSLAVLASTLVASLLQGAETVRILRNGG